MFKPDLTFENALRFSRFDEDDLLSTFSPHPIFLEDRQWPTVEHYVQAQLAANANHRENIARADTPQLAYQLGNPWYRRKRKGWKNLRRVLMTRGLYTKCMMYPEVKEFILASGDQLITETSAFDHYWGIGRDLRGENMLGKIWMDIRNKLNNDAHDEKHTGKSIGQI